MLPGLRKGFVNTGMKTQQPPLVCHEGRTDWPSASQTASQLCNLRQKQHVFHNGILWLSRNKVNPTSRENAIRVCRCCAQITHNTWHTACLPLPQGTVTYWLYSQASTLIDLIFSSLNYRKGLQMYDQTHQYSRITTLQALYITSSTTLTYNSEAVKISSSFSMLKHWNKQDQDNSMNKGTVTTRYLLAASQRQGSILYHLQKILLTPKCSLKKRREIETTGTEHKQSNEWVSAWNIRKYQN